MTTRLWVLAADLVRRVKADASYDLETSSLPDDGGRTVSAVQLALVRRRRQLAFRRGALRVAGIAAAAACLLAAGRLFLPSGPPAQGTHAGAHAQNSPRLLSVLESAPASNSTRPGGAVIGDGSGSRSVTNGMTLQTGSRLVAPPDAEVRIGSADGTVLTLEADGEMAVVEQSSRRRFSLRRGAVRAQVAKLQSSERFIIATADSEVEVHGTTFRVSMAEGDLACANGIRTRVSVFEGVVSVRTAGGESFIPAGATWPSCAAGTSSANTPRPTLTSGGNRAVPTRSLVRKRAGLVSLPGDRPPLLVAAQPPTDNVPSPLYAGAETSGLAAANDLFAAAVHAKRHGRFADSVRLFSRLIEVAPESALVEGARVQKMKLLARLDRGAARKAAMEYLSYYPQGFARDDARRLAGTSP